MVGVKLAKVILILLLFIRADSFAKESLDIYLDNDSRLLKPNGATDRHYTHGTRVVYLLDDVPEWGLLDHFGGWSFDNKEVDRKFGIFLGQNIYTPDDDEKPPARRSAEDMQFAGWLYTGFFMQRFNEDKLEHAELNLGVIGPSSLGENSQDCIHGLINSEKGKWEDQIADELAVDLVYMIRERVGSFGSSERFDVLAEYGFTAGSVHRHAEIGFILRYGVNLEGDFGPGRLDFPISPSYHGEPRASYLYLRLSGRAVEHNRFLTGLTEEPLVGALQLGLMHHYKSLNFGYSQTFYTQEFKEQKGNDSIGSLVLSWAF